MRKILTTVMQIICGIFVIILVSSCGKNSEKQASDKGKIEEFVWGDNTIFGNEKDSYDNEETSLSGEKTDITDEGSKEESEDSEISTTGEVVVTEEETVSTERTTVTTQRETAPPTTIETTTARYKVSTVEEQGNTQNIEIKYGVNKQVTNINVYDVYSNGDKVFSYSYTINNVDNSGYNASDDQLRTESEANVTTYSAYLQEVLRLVNVIRAEVGVSPLVLDDKLCAAANMRAIEMDYADYFQHSRANGESCFTVLDYFGINCFYSGENIAAGHSSPAQVVEAWKNSPGHYANMIRENYTKLGVGYSSAGIGSYGRYWVQLFTD